MVHLCLGWLLTFPAHETGRRSSLRSPSGKGNPMDHPMQPNGGSVGDAAVFTTPWTGPGEPTDPVTEVTLSPAAFRSLFDYLSETVICMDGDGLASFVSGGVRGFLGYDPDSLLGKDLFGFVHPDDLPVVAAGLARWDGRRGTPLGHRIRARTADGTWREVCYDAQIGVDMGTLGSIVITLYDPADRSEEVRRLRYRLLVEDRLSRLASIVLHAPTSRFEDALDEAAREVGTLDWVGRVSVWTVDPHERDRLVKRAESAAPTSAPSFGLSRSFHLDSFPALRRVLDGVELHLDAANVSAAPLSDQERKAFNNFGLQSMLVVPLLAEDTFLGILLLESITGDVAHDSITTATARAAATFLAGALQRNQAERLLAEHAHTDRVTGLGNRWAFDDALHQALTSLNGDRSAGFGLALVDLDRFKLVNDALGHAAGDRLLKKIADRLTGAADDHTVLGRLGGDELLVLIDRSPTVHSTRERVNRLLQSLATPFDVDGHAMGVTASVGVVHVAEAEAAAAGPGELLRRADVAMYRAKARGGNAVEMDNPYEQGDDGATLRREAELRDALSRRALEVHFQGEWDLETGRLVGAEALVRWPHPTLGLLSAGQFVPLAEERGLITELSWMVLREACRTAAAWTSTVASDGFVLRVNVAADQLRNRDFADRVVETLHDVGYPPELLCLELTESTLLSDPKGSAELFNQLRGNGIGLAIDDFGTGYSSMLQLKQLPLTALKIDRSFVTGLPATSIDRAVVRTAVQLAEALDASVTAEGVERPDQVTALVELGCTRAQGFLLARPEPAAEFERRVLSSCA